MKSYSDIEIEQFKERIKDIIAKHPKTYGHILKSKKNRDILIFLDAMFPQLSDKYYTLNTKLFWLFNGLSDFPNCKCPDCNNKNTRNAISLTQYTSYCSRSCAARDPNTIQKIQSTNLKRHGVKCTLQTEKAWDAIHKAVIKKYGGTTGNIWETEYGKNRCKETKLEKNDGKFESEETTQKRKDTIISRYGGTSGNIFGTEHGRSSCKRTWKKKYGFEHPNQNQEKRKHISEYMQSSEVQEKRNNTMKQNHSFNTSKPEEEAYRMLCEKFGADDVIRQYKSELYPFNCDFYVSSQDMFIEFQGSWTHGTHAFDPSSQEDVDKLNNLKLKMMRKKHQENSGHKFYKTAIRVWTVTDPLKRETAKKNSLSFHEFWTLDSLKRFLDDVQIR